MVHSEAIYRGKCSILKRGEIYISEHLLRQNGNQNGISNLLSLFKFAGEYIK
jgi:hypothetical protein